MLLYPRALPGLLSLFSLPLNTGLCCCTLISGLGLVLCVYSVFCFMYVGILGISCTGVAPEGSTLRSTDRVGVVNGPRDFLAYNVTCGQREK